MLADDALRAVQVLPGVATGDDFRSEFTVRGSDFGHLNFTVDGFATPFLLHMVRAVEERANTGSVTMINSDVLEEVTLSNGSYAQRSGNQTGAELAFVMREGSRDRNVVRAAVSGTSASAVAEGPLGRSKRGSWLLSGRKSYLNLLIDRLSDEGLSFGFGDVQAKLRYDLTDGQTASLTFIAGKSTLKETQTPQEPADDELFIGNNASAILIANWRRTLRKGTFSVGIFGATNSFDNHTIIGTNLDQRSSGCPRGCVAQFLEDRASRIGRPRRAHRRTPGAQPADHVNKHQFDQRLSQSRDPAGRIRPRPGKPRPASGSSRSANRSLAAHEPDDFLSMASDRARSCTRRVREGRRRGLSAVADFDEVVSMTSRRRVLCQALPGHPALTLAAP